MVVLKYLISEIQSCGQSRWDFEKDVSFKYVGEETNYWYMILINEVTLKL